MVDFVPKIDPPTDNEHPLIKFSGVLKDYQSEQITRENGTSYLKINFNFTDVEVIESNEPYNFPIATVAVGYSERAKTLWDVLARSMRDVLPESDIRLLVGKRQTWHRTDCVLRRPDKEGNWGDQPAKGWQVVSVDNGSNNGSSGGGNIMGALAVLADGKTEPEFYKAIISDPNVKSMAGFSSIVEALTDRTLVSSLTTAGLVEVKDGKLVRVQ